ncbi:uncharacterized protein LOC143521163 [Brachyhypopomus gauderio]|uniref:uncharacterized protein LOC143521163 n=1 Tax=Brachyhypopomus gauderio TaxID=698409 RepID=UPI0040413BBF
MNYEELLKVCQEKDEEISKLHTALEQCIDTASQYRAAATHLNAQNQALSSMLVELQKTTSNMSSKLQALEMDLSTQTNTVLKLSEELKNAEALLRDCEEERCQRSNTISSLKLEVGDLQQKLLTLSQGESERISYLHTEMVQARTHANLLQKEVQTLTEGVWVQRMKTDEAEGERNRALSAQEQTAAQLKTEQVKSQDILQKYQETCQLLQTKDTQIQELRRTLADKDRAHVQQERRLDARHKIRSLRGELGTRESRRACGPNHTHPKGDDPKGKRKCTEGQNSQASKNWKDLRLQIRGDRSGWAHPPRPHPRYPPHPRPHPRYPPSPLPSSPLSPAPSPLPSPAPSPL